MTAELILLARYDWPLFVLTAGAMLALLTAVLPRGHRLLLTTLLAAAALLVSAAGFFCLWKDGRSWTGAFLLGDPLAHFLAMLATLIGFVSLATSYSYWREQKEPLPEFPLLVLFGVLGMVLLASANHLLSLVLGLEVMSIALYVLVALRRGDPKSSEASFKYFLLGSVATAFLLFGISLLYGATGRLDLAGIAQAQVPADLLLLLKLGAMLVLAGFAFKVAAVPFHFWAPDVYDGAPVAVTGFMAAGVKVAAFGALIRVLEALVPFESLPLQNILLALALATMVIGNVTALRQRSLKRIMAYSSISHAGYLLLGSATLLSGGRFLPENLGAILFYLLTYSLLTVGAFAVLTALSRGGREIGDLADLDGLSEAHPLSAAVLAVFLISLAGLPPTAGFLAKYYLFSQAIERGFYGYAVAGILASAVSLYYYLGPVVRMYFRRRERAEEVPAPGWVWRVLLLAMTAGTLYFGIRPLTSLWTAASVAGAPEGPRPQLTAAEKP